MLGRTHALSGTVTGLATGTAVLHLAVTPLTMYTGLVTACALMPDLDSCGSTAARSLGFITDMCARFVRKISGGHRHGTHSLAGIAAFGAVAWLAGAYWRDPAGKAALAVILAVGFASALDALRIGGRRARHVRSLAALGGAAVIIAARYDLWLIPVAAVAGTAVHIAGDCLTKEGCPLMWPLSLRKYRLLPGRLAFTTGTRPESWIVAPVLLLALGWLIWRAAGQPGMTASW